METKNAPKERIQFKPPVFSQIACMIFGVIFAFSEKYTGMELVLAVLCGPVVFAGMVRVIIAMYRVVANLTAKRVYDESGACVGLIPSRGVSIVAALVGFAGIITGFIKAAQFSKVLTIVIIVTALALEVFVFYKDLKRFFQLRKPHQEN